MMQTNLLSVKLLICTCCLFGTFQSLFAQDHIINIARRADVLDGAKTHEFNKLPELKSVGNELSVHLFVDENVYDFLGTKIKMRSYRYESGKHQLTPIGPWGPTLRIGQDDRLNIIVHNDLSAGGDQNYLGWMPLKEQRLLKEGALSKELKEMLVERTTYPSRGGAKPIIKAENLKNATLKVLEAGKLWLVTGQEVCKCPPGQEGTCVKEDVFYPIKRTFNYGNQQEEGLRIYQFMVHGEDHDHNIPHGFNTTNMHTHGFHVSPFQDDVFRKVPPGDVSYYTYKLDNHTPGTMWYHPHVHGSTALQVASGMSGAIIIEDPNLSAYPALAAASVPEQERLMVFNQIMYDEDIGELPDFNTLMRVNSRGSQGPKGTTINGVTKPNMRMQKGEVQRWRLVHSGYHSNLALHFPEEIEVMQIAVDGIMFKEARKVRSIHMAPGNRMDLLVKVPTDIPEKSYDVLSVNYKFACEYFVEDEACTQLSGENETMLQIVVEGERPEMRLADRLPGPVEHPDILNRDLVNLGNPRLTDFNIQRSKVDTTRFDFMVNDEPFQANKIHETLTLGTAEEWKLSSTVGSHPYHIHINPFQVTKFGDRIVSPPMWKDVVMTPSSDPIMIRSRYTRYWGDFVLHCHLLHHEDQGMMQRVRIKRSNEVIPAIKSNKTEKK